MDLFADPADAAAERRRLARRKNRTPIRLERTGIGRAVFHRQGGYTKLELDGDMLRWATSTWVCQSFLDRLAAERNLERRARLGDRHGGWQKIAEIPTDLFFDQVPKEALEDIKYINRRVINNADYRYLRADGNHRIV